MLDGIATGFGAGDQAGLVEIASAAGNFAANHPLQAAIQAVSIGAMLVPGFGEGAVAAEGAAGETFYRTMTLADFAQLTATGKVPATAQTFISPSLGYASGYEGVTVQFNVASGTAGSLFAIGVRSPGLTMAPYDSLDLVQSGWTSTSAFFKLEGGVVNIGLGQGPALNIFNNAITGFWVVP